MKTSTALAASLLAFLPHLAPTNAAQVIQMDIYKQTDSTPAKLKARAAFPETLINNVTGGSYRISTAVGTPAQNVTLVLDTGSTDTYVLANTADQCTSARLQRLYGPCVGGTFTRSQSSTYKLVNSNFAITYGDGSGSTGLYFNDTFSLSGGRSLTSQQLGLALQTTVGTGIMGVGYDTNEASRTIYPSVIDNMVSQGLIATKAYSLWLNDLDASTGSILFGGLDSAKYQGSLIAVPLLKSARTGQVSTFTVPLTAVSASVGSASNTSTLTSSTYSTPVLLDSGTTLSYLPVALTNSIYSAFNVIDDTADSGEAFIDCAYLSTTSSLTYTFGGSSGPSIVIDISELVFDYNLVSTSQYTLPFERTCLFGIQSSPTSSSYILGDTFLRSAYVVYDLAANQVALAQTKFNATDSNIQELTGVTIPNVSGVASSATGSVTATDVPGVGSRTTSQSAAPTSTRAVGSGTTVLTGTVGSSTTSSSTRTASAAASSSMGSGADKVTTPFFSASTIGIGAWGSLCAVMGAAWLFL